MTARVLKGWALGLALLPGMALGQTVLSQDPGLGAGSLGGPSTFRWTDEGERHLPAARALRCKPWGPVLRLHWTETGGPPVGLPPARQGFGTRMLSAMVQRLDGTIEESDNAPGLRFTVTAPIGVPGDA